MNPAMLQYLQQLYGNRANMPAQVNPGVPQMSQPFNPIAGGQTNWTPPQIADDSGMYGPTLATLAGQTGSPNLVNAGYWNSMMPRPSQGPMPTQPRNAGMQRPGVMPGNRGMSQPHSPMPMRPITSGVAQAPNNVVQGYGGAGRAGNQMQGGRKVNPRLWQGAKGL